MREKKAKILYVYLFSTGVFFVLLGILLSTIFPLMWWLFVLAGTLFCLFSTINLIRHSKKE